MLLIIGINRTAMVLFSESGVLKPNLSKVQLVQIESGHWKGQTGKYCHYHCFGTKCIKCILNYRTIFDSIQSVQSVDDWFINDYLWARTMWGRKSCKRCHQFFCVIYFEYFTFRSPPRLVIRAWRLRGKCISLMHFPGHWRPILALDCQIKLKVNKRFHLPVKTLK